MMLLLLLPLIVAAAGVIYNLNRSERVKHLSSVLQNWVLVYFLSNELATASVRIRIRIRVLVNKLAMPCEYASLHIYADF